jgi:hypothetical protein
MPFVSDEEKENYKLELTEMKVSELRKLMRNQGALPLDRIVLIVTEYKRRIPYCEICGEKCPVFSIRTLRDEDGAVHKERVCPTCTRTMNDMEIDFMCIWDGEY